VSIAHTYGKARSISTARALCSAQEALRVRARSIGRYRSFTYCIPSTSLSMSIYGSTPPPPMSTPGSRARAIGLTITLLSVSGGIHFSSTCGFGLLLSFTGILAGANLVAFGVSKADDNPAPTFPTAFDSARALAAFMRRSTATAGLVMASCAVTAVSGGEADLVLFFAMFALLLLGVSLVIAGARGE
jgi:hypothetical protein